MHVFRSKKDWWLLAFVICMSGLLLQLLLTMQAKGTMQQYPLHTAVYILTILILWWPLWSTRYVVDNGVLTIKSLWLSWKIPLSEIQSIQPTDHSIIAPACRNLYWFHPKIKLLLYRCFSRIKTDIESALVKLLLAQAEPPAVHRHSPDAD